MTEPLSDLKMFPELEFSYGQFFIYDAELVSPACEWTELHSRQGFARREQAIAVGTLLSFGIANVSIALGSPTNFEAYDRVLSVPLEVKTGTIAVDGPEESPGDRQVSVENGHYRVTIGQMRLDDMHEDIKIWFEKLASPLQCSNILIIDDDLDPPNPLIEIADPVSL